MPRTLHTLCSAQRGFETHCKRQPDNWPKREDGEPSEKEEHLRLEAQKVSDGKSTLTMPALSKSSAICGGTVPVCSENHLVQANHQQEVLSRFQYSKGGTEVEATAGTRQAASCPSTSHPPPNVKTLRLPRFPHFYREAPKFRLLLPTRHLAKEVPNHSLSVDFNELEQ